MSTISRFRHWPLFCVDLTRHTCCSALLAPGKTGCRLRQLVHAMHTFGKATQPLHVFHMRSVHHGHNPCEAYPAINVGSDMHGTSCKLDASTPSLCMSLSTEVLDVNKSPGHTVQSPIQLPAHHADLLHRPHGPQQQQLHLCDGPHVPWQCVERGFLCSHGGRAPHSARSVPFNHCQCWSICNPCDIYSQCVNGMRLQVLLCPDMMCGTKCGSSLFGSHSAQP